jgi:hypothetical protein
MPTFSPTPEPEHSVVNISIITIGSLLAAAALACWVKQNRATNQKKEELARVSSHRMDNPMHAPSGDVAQPTTIFISWRKSECEREANKLQAALQSMYGIKAETIKGEAGNTSVLEAVSKAMDEAALFVVMGTETYGKQTYSGSIDTYNEMQFIQSSGKPFFLINMNPNDSSGNPGKKFKEASANLILSSTSTMLPGGDGKWASRWKRS